MHARAAKVQAPDDDSISGSVAPHLRILVRGTAFCHPRTSSSWVLTAGVRARIAIATDAGPHMVGPRCWA
eukprot:CAMPEP_0194300068 /NCGR_PEP_ID=MMETSP0169-20130528/61057_1 /TAXON_ID=218684 /ORGANISM="Corethron pennatum, Strain L29A3" /LENGTH=69 /DNA_ID=CAMNT_0039050205 /DNA_START=647 /DNA_END=857 /DNA_ORIENTATION=+